MPRPEESHVQAVQHIEPDRIAIPNKFGSCKLYWKCGTTTTVKTDDRSASGTIVYQVDSVRTVAAIKCGA